MDNCEMMEKRKLISRLVRPTPTPPPPPVLLSCWLGYSSWPELKMYLQPFESVDVVGVVKEEELGRKNQHYVQKECRSLWVDKAIRWIKMESR